MIDHSKCDHDKTRAARAACRRAQAGDGPHVRAARVKAAEPSYCEGCEAEGRKLNTMGYCGECVLSAVRAGHASGVGVEESYQPHCEECGSEAPTMCETGKYTKCCGMPLCDARQASCWHWAGHEELLDDQARPLLG